MQTDRPCSCGSECEAGLRYLQQFECELRHDIPKGGLAAFWAESIQGVGGTIQYPKNYIKGIYQRVKDQGGLYVADEVRLFFFFNLKQDKCICIHNLFFFSYKFV